MIRYTVTFFLLFVPLAHAQQAPASQAPFSSTAPSLETLKAIIDERDRRYEQRMNDMDKLNNLSFANSKEAVQTANTANEKRLDSVNEFRGVVTDQQKALIMRTEFEAAMKKNDDNSARNEERINEVQRTLAAKDSEKSGANDLWIIIASVVGVGVIVYGALRVQQRREVRR